MGLAVEVYLEEATILHISEGGKKYVSKAREEATVRHISEGG